MDIITHIAMGAVTGELIGRNRIGNKAILFGSAAQVLPDIDVVAALWLSPVDNVIFHRSITHSLIYNVAAAGLLGYLWWKFYDRQTTWLFPVSFLLAQFAIHLFVDLLNGYGAGLLEPFDSTKFSLHSLFVVDAVLVFTFSIPALLILFMKNEQLKKRIAISSVSFCLIYIAVSILNGIIVRNRANDQLKRERISCDRLLITPTPFNSCLWFVAAETPDGYYTGYQSSFHPEQRIAFSFRNKGVDLSDEITDTLAFRKLKEFSDNFYILEKKNGRIVFSDLCFGQIAGWTRPDADFAFHYYLDGAADNKYVMQRGRFSGWNKQTVTSLVSSILNGVSPSDENKK